MGLDIKRERGKDILKGERKRKKSVNNNLISLKSMWFKLNVEKRAFKWIFIPLSKKKVQNNHKINQSDFNIIQFCFILKTHIEYIFFEIIR